jgi:hypothetical protein
MCSHARIHKCFSKEGDGGVPHPTCGDSKLHCSRRGTCARHMNQGCLLVRGVVA